ncbi:hypothetical protein RB195_020278 [Necator americanus]|uniref:Uncharacterized protein n=1 Tax=Necator americanus TaxID=51031 RepID=A0ABR1CKE7_NECAM
MRLRSNLRDKVNGPTFIARTLISFASSTRENLKFELTGGRSLLSSEPVRYITKIPNEIMLTVENVDEEADYELLQQKVELEGRKPLRERYFG